MGRVGRYRSKSQRARLSVTLVVALIGVFFIFLSKSAEDVAMADDGRTDLQSQLQHLQTATNIVLMIIPHDVFFRFGVDEKRLPEVSCVHQIQSGRGSSFADVREIIESSIIEFQKGPRILGEVRIGIVFKNGNDVLQEFYFEDGSGVHEINGRSGGYRILASPDTPNRLRSLLTRQDVVLIKSGHSPCPHS